MVFGLLASVLLAVCIGPLLWLAGVSGGPAFLQEVIRMQFPGRMDGSEGSNGALYYFTSSMGNYALAWPLAVLTLGAAALTGSRETGPALRLMHYCVAAGLIVMLGLSIPQAKRPATCCRCCPWRQSWRRIRFTRRRVNGLPGCGG